MHKQYPLNPRRLERLMLVVALKQKTHFSSPSDMNTLSEKIAPYDKDKVFSSLPVEVQQRICRNAFAMVKGIEENKETLLAKLEKAVYNRPIKDMPLIDQCLLLLGAYEFQFNKSDPKIIVKELLICSDTMGNENAGRYLSGILKTLAFGPADNAEHRPPRKYHQAAKDGYPQKESGSSSFRDNFAGKRPPKISLRRKSSDI